ncbi:MAG: adenylosuccinate lyase [Candidatus Pacebacteria bacterium RIFCSPLOWO2_01_FULL_47_12]|nr:MAG: adenylosuccinate lyase [Candidatus Pacebacteria bacterium RIFCSPHIGHO2_02_FULL_46_9]OGJ39413.1 MAG: adenylosuccinate lyase [Candidatus Pacebacteria bacterium RIFCSPLOWO2_01_FULL_47_12]
MTDAIALQALSPLDGRYQQQTRELTGYFSEFALIRYRVRFEVAYLVAFLETTKIVTISAKQIVQLRKVATLFSLADAQAVKAHEMKCHHDVKAVEYFLQDTLTVLGLTNLTPYIHFSLTSEDCNSVAYGLALKESRDAVLLPALQQLIAALVGVVEKYADLPMLARTHGQPAVPTTLGKEYAVFLARLLPEITAIAATTFVAKISGAVGTYSAQSLAFPEVEWLAFTKKLLNDLGLVADPLSTQVVSAESMVRFFQTLQRINNILLDCARDSWQYIADGWLVQTTTATDVGSSTMPQKVNPIDFENAEGNFGLANALLAHLSEKLPISRLQRDLSDSTVKRSIGVALGHSLLGYQSLVRGLGKVSAHPATMAQALSHHPEIISEGLQTLLRADGVSEAYEIFKAATRGKQLGSLEELRGLATKHARTKTTKQKIAALTPKSYLGLATQLARQTLNSVAKYQKGQYASATK